MNIKDLFTQENIVCMICVVAAIYFLWQPLKRIILRIKIGKCTVEKQATVIDILNDQIRGVVYSGKVRASKFRKNNISIPVFKYEIDGNEITSTSLVDYSVYTGYKIGEKAIIKYNPKKPGNCYGVIGKQHKKYLYEMNYWLSGLLGAVWGRFFFIVRSLPDYYDKGMVIFFMVIISILMYLGIKPYKYN